MVVSNKPQSISDLRQRGINPFSLLADEKPTRTQAPASRETAAKTSVPSAPSSAPRVGAPPSRGATKRAAGAAVAGAAVLAQAAVVAGETANSCSQLFKSPDGKFYDVYDNVRCALADPAFLVIRADCGSKQATLTELALRTWKGNWNYLRGSNSALDAGLRAESSGGDADFERCAKSAFDAVLSAFYGSPSPALPPSPMPSPISSPPPGAPPSSSGSSGLPPAAIAGIAAAGACVLALSFFGVRKCWQALSNRGGSRDIELGRR